LSGAADGSAAMTAEDARAASVFFSLANWLIRR
jgi:hypothetical protein